MEEIVDGEGTKVRECCGLFGFGEECYEAVCDVCRPLLGGSDEVVADVKNELMVASS